MTPLDAVLVALVLSAGLALLVLAACMRCSQCGAYKESETCVNCPPAGPETPNP